MRIALSGFTGKDSTVLSQLIKSLEESHIQTLIMNSSNQAIAKDVDLVLVPGGDRGILNYFHKVSVESAPVLGIYESNSTGFLAQIDIKEIEKIKDKLKSGNYDVREEERLAVNVDGKDVEPVLNDVAIFSNKSAILMEHFLRINNKDIWHDNSDGVIIATPIGSTAYAMSAGGPIVLQNSHVFVAISVNSLDNTRRPLIVSSDSSIEIADITSSHHCEVILDGTFRIKISDKLLCHKHEFPAKLVTLNNNYSATNIIEKKVKYAEDLLKMPPSAKLILKTLEYEGTMTQKDLINKTMLPERTIRLSLSHLLNRGYVKKKISLRDARQKIYELKI
jgi:NAD+ kinase